MAFESSSDEMKPAYEKANGNLIFTKGSAINASRKLCLVLAFVNACDHHGAHHGDGDEHELKSDVTADVSGPDYGPDASVPGFVPGFVLGGDDGAGENSYGLFHRGLGL